MKKRKKKYQSNNGNISQDTRRTVSSILRLLRNLRENADYRMGHTVDAQSVNAALVSADNLFERLEIRDA